MIKCITSYIYWPHKRMGTGSVWLRGGSMVMARSGLRHPRHGDPSVKPGAADG